MAHTLASISAVALALASLVPLAAHAAPDAAAHAAPDTGLVASAEVGGGVASVAARSTGIDSINLSGVASSVRLGAGAHRGRLDFGLTGAALRAWSTQSSTASIAFQRPDQFLMLSIGPFVGYRPARDLPLTLGARVELARGQMTGSTAVANLGAFPGPGRPAIDFFQPGNGVLGAVRADYALEGRYGAATFGLEAEGRLAERRRQHAERRHGDGRRRLSLALTHQSFLSVALPATFALARAALRSEWPVGPSPIAVRVAAPWPGPRMSRR